MSNKVKVPGGAFYAGDGLTVDQTTRTVSAGGGSSVSTPDWNQNDATASDYIKNRPFYSEKQVETVAIWDGDKTDKVSVLDSYYKVSDSTPTYTDGVFVCYMKSVETETSITLSWSDIKTDYSGFLLFSDYAIICYDTSQLLFGRFSFPETGIYFLNDNGSFTTKVERVIETVKTIDRKYLEKKFVVDSTNLPTDSTGWNKLNESLKDAYQAGDTILLDINGNNSKALLKLTNVYDSHYLFVYTMDLMSISAYILAVSMDSGSLKQITITPSSIPTTEVTA